MSEQEQVPGNSQEQATDTSTSYETMAAKIREELKSEISGLNRKIGELTKEKAEIALAAEEEAKAKLTVSQRLELMEERLESAKLDAEREKTNSIMTKKAITQLEAAGLPSSIIDKINITDDSTIEKDIEFYQSLLSGYEKTAKDEVRKKHAFKPSGGEAKTVVPKSLRDCKTKEEKIAYLASKKEQ